MSVKKTARLYVHNFDELSSVSSLSSIENLGQISIEENRQASPEEYCSSWNVYLAVLCAQMSSVAMGCSFGWSAPALEDMHDWLDSPYKPKSNEGNWLASVLTFGALIGALFCGFLMDFFGRRLTLIVLGIPYCAGWALIGFSRSFYLILIGRIMTGFAIGITTAVLPTYIAEISTPNNRGLLGMSFNFFVVLGVVFLDIIYIFNFHWHQLALWSLLPSLLLSISMIFMPETPSWCVNKIKNDRDSIERAHSSLQRLRAPGSNIDAELKELIESSNRANISKLSKLKLSLNIFNRADVYKPMLIGMLLLFFQQFCGINAVQFYLNDIFKKSSSMLSPKVSTLISNIFMLLATILGALIIDRFGRKILYASSAFGLAVSIAALGVYKFVHRNHIITETTTKVGNLTTMATTLAVNTTKTSEPPLPIGEESSILPIIFITIFVSAFSLGVGPICWIIITEITPSNTIGLISSTSSAFAWIFTFLVVNFSGDVMRLITEFGTYWIFAIISLISIIFIYFLPETKGKSAEQILEIFNYDL